MCFLERRKAPFPQPKVLILRKEDVASVDFIIHYFGFILFHEVAKFSQNTL